MIEVEAPTLKHLGVPKFIKQLGQLITEENRFPPIPDITYIIIIFTVPNIDSN